MALAARLQVLSLQHGWHTKQNVRKNVDEWPSPIPAPRTAVISADVDKENLAGGRPRGKPVSDPPSSRISIDSDGSSDKPAREPRRRQRGRQTLITDSSSDSSAPSPIPTAATRKPAVRIVLSDSDDEAAGSDDAAPLSPAALPMPPLDHADAGSCSDDSFYSCQGAPSPIVIVGRPPAVAAPSSPPSVPGPLVIAPPASCAKPPRTPARQRIIVDSPVDVDSGDDAAPLCPEEDECVIISDGSDSATDTHSVDSDSSHSPIAREPIPTHTPAKSNRSFVAKRPGLTAAAFAEFNGTVFGNRLPSNLSIQWSNRMR